MKIYSVFLSLSGEIGAYPQGSFATFIRMSGCNFRCIWCDALYAQDFNSGSEVSIENLMNKVREIGCKKVLITGGEPLFQKNELKKLIKTLKMESYFVSVETNGYYFPPTTWGVDCWIVDWKCPSSGMHTQMNIDYFLILRSFDFIKFVIADEKDYHYALDIYKQLEQYGCKAQIAFSPVLDRLNVNILVGWLKKAGLFDIIVSCQLHKLIGLIESR